MKLVLVDLSGRMFWRNEFRSINGNKTNSNLEPAINQTTEARIRFNCFLLLFAAAVVCLNLIFMNLLNSMKRRLKQGGKEENRLKPNSNASV